MTEFSLLGEQKRSVSVANKWQDRRPTYQVSQHQFAYRCPLNVYHACQRGANVEMQSKQNKCRLQIKSIYWGHPA